jgi:SAM-dependent methyltransferase
VSVYDPIARIYDPWSRTVTEDISFYVEEALTAGGLVVELGVGTGRIAIPTAMAGVNVIGVDSSPGMLEVCAEGAQKAGVAALVDLRLGDLRTPPVDERVKLVTCPFRAYLHLASDGNGSKASRRRGSCYGAAVVWFSTSSHPRRRTSRRRTGVGSSVSPASSSAPTGTVTRRR